MNRHALVVGPGGGVGVEGLTLPVLVDLHALPYRSVAPFPARMRSR